MTSSRKPRRDEDLPPTLSSMWRLCKIGYQHEPGLMLTSLVLALVSALPDALIALWFKMIADGVQRHDARLVRVAAIALGVSATGTWILRTVSTRVQRRFRDKITIALESHVARLLATITTIAHQERPEHLDRHAMLRDQVFVLDHMYMSVFSTAGWILRLGVTISLLMAIHPALALLALFALPAVATATWRPGVERVAQEFAAPFNRLARHLFVTATTAPPGKEVRVTGIGDRLIAERRFAWQTGHTPVARGAVGIGGMAHARVGGVWRRIRRRRGVRRAPVRVVGGQCAPRAGRRVAVVRLHWRDRRRNRISARLLVVWRAAARVAGRLRGVARRVGRCSGAVAHRHGVRLEHVSFAYPGTDRLVLDDVNLDLPAGAVVAIVGENGAGKSTLVKLLAKMYEPTRGRDS